MRATVTRAFECKLTKAVFSIGDTYASDDPERIKYLIGEGYLSRIPLTILGNVTGEQMDDVTVMEQPKGKKSSKKAR